MFDDDDDDESYDDCEPSGPVLGPLGTAIVATVVGGLVLMAISRALVRPVVIEQPPPEVRRLAA